MQFSGTCVCVCLSVCAFVSTHTTPHIYHTPATHPLAHRTRTCHVTHTQLSQQQHQRWHRRYHLPPIVGCSIIAPSCDFSRSARQRTPSHSSQLIHLAHTCTDAAHPHAAHRMLMRSETLDAPPHHLPHHTTPTTQPPTTRTTETLVPCTPHSLLTRFEGRAAQPPPPLEIKLEEEELHRRAEHKTVSLTYARVTHIACLRVHSAALALYPARSVL